MADVKNRAREYLAEHSKYSEVFGETFVAVDTMTAMVEFAEQETKGLKEQIEKMKCCENCKHKKSEVDRCELLMYSMNSCLCKNKDKWEIKEK